MLPDEEILMFLRGRAFKNGKVGPSMGPTDGIISADWQRGCAPPGLVHFCSFFSSCSQSVDLKCKMGMWNVWELKHGGEERGGTEPQRFDFQLDKVMQHPIPQVLD